MPWVMMPVPEELAADIEQLVFQLRYRDAMVKWTPELMRDHLLSLAEEPRVALCAVAAGVIDGARLDDEQLAAKLGIAVREVFGVIRDANDVKVADLVGDLIGIKQEPAADGSGGMRRVLNVLPLNAKMIHDEEVSLGLPRFISRAR